MNNVHKEEVVCLGKIFFTTTVLSIMACIIIDPIWGFYESFMAMMVSSSVSGVFITENYHMGMSPMTHVQAFLHYYLPSFSWTALLLFSAWVIIQALVIFLLLANKNLSSISFKKIFIVWAATMLLIFGVSFIEFSITGISMLLTSTSLLAIWKGYYQIKTPIIRWCGYLLLTFFVFWGYSMRIESGLGGTLIASVFVLIADRNLFRFLKLYWLPALAIILFFVRFYYVMNTHPFFRDVEPMVFYVTDSHNSPPVIATDSVDALIRKMSRASFLIDSATFNYDLFKKISDEKIAFEKEMFSARPKDIYKQISYTAFPTMQRNMPLLTIYLFTLTGLLFLFFRLKNNFFLLKTMLFNVSIWIIISSLAYSLKMEQWHFLPIIQLAIVGNLLFMIEHYEYFQKIKLILLFGLGALLLQNVWFLKKEIGINKRMIRERAATTEKIFSKQNGKFIFFDTSSREVLDDFVFRFFQMRENVIFYDMAQVAYLPDYERFLNETCQCNAHSVKEFFEFMRAESENIIYYSTENRMALLEPFLNIVHKIDVEFRPVEEIVLQDGRNGDFQIFRYELHFNE